jgi:hypothetical protein
MLFRLLALRSTPLAFSIASADCRNRLVMVESAPLQMMQMR